MELQQSLKLMIQDDFNMKDLSILLAPATMYTENAVFKHEMAEIIDIMTKDRNQNQRFDINDIILIGQDIPAIINLITILLMLINTPIKLVYVEGETEELVFKILVYVFLILLPTQLNQPLTMEEKEALLQVSLLIYTFLIQSKLLHKLVKKVIAWTKSKCSCLGTDKLTKLKIDLEKSINP